MNHNIRSYKNSDFEMISNWWKECTGMSPLENMLVEDGTFILELKNCPVLCATTLLTQAKDIAYINCFIKNPKFKNISLNDYGRILWDHCCDYAKNHGYSRVICFSNIPKLFNKYEKFGFNKDLNNLTSFVRIL